MSRIAAREANQPTSLPAPKGRRPRAMTYKSTSRVDRLESRHPGVRALIESLLHRRIKQAEIAREVEKRFGLKISASAISRYWAHTVLPQEEAEAEAYRQARGQARALLEEMKADPKLDASQIAEIMLANQIVKDRMKLAEADILDLYREQRERKKLELQRKTFLLREKQAMKVLEKMKASKGSTQLGPEVLDKIRAIYGLSASPEPADSQ
jgi:hypothetical protein